MFQNQSKSKSCHLIYSVIFLMIVLYFGIDGDRHVSASSVSKDKAAVHQSAVKYVTTAYYLNVRANSSSKSKILKVVKKGSALSVLDKTATGWLKLDGGGYVHGAYAEPADPIEKLAEPSLPQKAASKTGKPNSAVRSKSGLTEDSITQVIKGTGLAGYGLEKAVVELETDFGINAFFTIAVMKLESGNGTSRVAKTRNNLFGLNSSNGTGYLRFKTKVDSVRKFGQLISKNYIGKGYTTIEKIAGKYCPANAKWPVLVKNIMQRDYKKI